MKLYIKIVAFLLLIASCTNIQQKDTQKSEIDKSEFNIAKKHIRIVPIHSKFQKEIKDWKELEAIQQFMQKFETVSPTEALTNAIQLRDLTKMLKDSVKPKLFDLPSFNARVNVFYNETLRLADLTFIPAATVKDINLQVEKTRSTFSAINAKINTILSKKKFEDEIDVDFTFIGLDSTKIDTITKKSINTKKQEDKLRKKMKVDESRRKQKLEYLKPDQ